MVHLFILNFNSSYFLFIIFSQCQLLLLLSDKIIHLKYNLHFMTLCQQSIIILNVGENNIIMSHFSIYLYVTTLTTASTLGNVKRKLLII